jgi:hypothetical protein
MISMSHQHPLHLLSFGTAFEVREGKHRVEIVDLNVKIETPGREVGSDGTDADPDLPEL